MNTKKIALSLLIVASSALSDASAPKIAAQVIKKGHSKLANAAKVAGIAAGVAFVAEVGYCGHVANWKHEESVELFVTRQMARAYNADKFIENTKATITETFNSFGKAIPRE